MTRVFVLAAVIVAALSSSLSAQWPLHQAPGVPKTPDGKVDLNAPAPRTFTLDDPNAYTRPFTVRVDQRLMADGSDLIEYIGHENQQFMKKVKVD